MFLSSFYPVTNSEGGPKNAITLALVLLAFCFACATDDSAQQQCQVVQVEPLENDDNYIAPGEQDQNMGVVGENQVLQQMLGVDQQISTEEEFQQLKREWRKSHDNDYSIETEEEFRELVEEFCHQHPDAEACQ